MNKLLAKTTENFRFLSDNQFFINSIDLNYKKKNNKKM